MHKGGVGLLIAIWLLGGCVYPYARSVPIYESAPPPRPLTQPVTVEDVLKLSAAGVSEDIILAKLQAEGVAAKPSAEQIVTLKTAGVSDRVIAEMLAARAPVTREPERPVVYYRYEYYPGWYYYPWWYAWPSPYWHFHFYWRHRH
jgi:hypothetical protein